MKFVPKIFFFRAEYARAVLGNYDNGGLKNIITRMPDIIDKWRELDKQVTLDNDVKHDDNDADNKCAVMEIMVVCTTA